MTGRAPISPEAHQHLSGAAQRLTSYLNSAPSLMDRSINTPAADSRLAAEMSNQSAFTPTSTATIYLHGAINHFGLVHQGLSADAIAVLGLTTVVRGALEASVRALWLLDPVLSTRERIERGLLERCANIHSGQRVNPDAARLTARNADVRAVAAAHSIQVAGHLPNSPLPRTVGGNPRPSATHLAEDALTALDRSNRASADPDRSGQNNRWFYAWLSAVAHSAGWALIDQLPGERSPGEHARAQVAGSAKNLAGAIDMVRQIHWLAVQRLAQLAGHHNQ